MMAMLERAGMGKRVLLTIALALALAATGCATGPAPMASHGRASVPTFYSPAMSGEGGGGR
jgi:hypothetical protein